MGSEMCIRDRVPFKYGRESLWSSSDAESVDSNYILLFAKPINKLMSMVIQSLSPICYPLQVFKYAYYMGRMYLFGKAFNGDNMGDGPGIGGVLIEEPMPRGTHPTSEPTLVAPVPTATGEDDLEALRQETYAHDLSLIHI